VQATIPFTICENETLIFDYVGPFVLAGMQVNLKTDFNGNSFLFTTASDGNIKVTYFIETYIDGNGIPRYRQGIKEGVHNSFDFSLVTNTNGYFSFDQTNFNKNSIAIKDVVYQTNSGTRDGQDVSAPINFGWSPNWIVQDHNGNINSEWLAKITPACMQDAVILKSVRLICASTKLKLSVIELDYNYVDHVFAGAGSEFVLNGLLTSAEVDDLSGSAGLDIAAIVSEVSRSTNNTTISFDPGKYYGIKIINIEHGRWQETTKFIQISEEKWDLVLKDNNKDKGQEPIEVWARDVFRSPYLWNRLNDVSQPAPTDYSKHEDLDYVNTAGNTNRMFFEVENIGCDASPANVPLRLFWTRARSNEKWDHDWIYDLTDHTLGGNSIEDGNGSLHPLGSEITIPSPTNNTYSKVTTFPNLDAVQLPSIPGNDSYVPAWSDGVDWFPPNNEWYMYSNTSTLSWRNADQRNIVCLLAKIGETNDILPNGDPIVWEGTASSKYAFPEVPSSEMVANNNNINTRNTILVENSSFFVGYGNNDWDYGYGTVMVPNSNPTPRNINLCLDLLDSDSSADFTAYGEIYIGVTDELWSSWISNGSPALTNAVVAEPGLFLATSGTHVCINDIDVDLDSEEQVGVRFLYQDAAGLPSTEEFYEYSLVEIDRSESAIPGSASVFQVTVPTVNPNSLLMKKDDRPEKTLVDNTLQMIVYPNPTSNILIIGLQMEADEEYRIQLLDITGKVMEEISGTAVSKKFSHVMDVKNYRSAVYFIELTTNGETKRQKVVINN
jgi:hypothetical protein